MKTKKSSPIWLIIFLSLVMVGLIWLAGESKYLKMANTLNGEIIKLNQEIETLTKEKQELEKVKKNILPLVSPLATPSSSPVSLLKLKSRTATASGSNP